MLPSKGLSGMATEYRDQAQSPTHVGTCRDVCVQAHVLSLLLRSRTLTESVPAPQLALGLSATSNLFLLLVMIAINTHNMNVT